MFFVSPILAVITTDIRNFTKLRAYQVVNHIFRKEENCYTSNGLYTKTNYH